jgi:hypothetical protein
LARYGVPVQSKRSSVGHMLVAPPHTVPSARPGLLSRRPPRRTCEEAWQSPGRRRSWGWSQTQTRRSSGWPKFDRPMRRARCVAPLERAQPARWSGRTRSDTRGRNASGRWRCSYQKEGECHTSRTLIVGYIHVTFFGKLWNLNFSKFKKGL